MENNKLNVENIEEIFEKVKPIVVKTMHHLKIRLWEYDDYLQEGMIILFDLLRFGCTEEKLYLHFKVRYRQHLIDEFRHLNVQKRHIDNLPSSLDVYEYADHLKGNYTTSENEVVYHSLNEELERKLSPKSWKLLRAQRQGEKMTRMEKYRIKQQIKSILYDSDDQ